MDYTLRWSQNKFNWNGQWSGTRSAISGEMKNGFGGVTNFNYSSKHFGVLRALRLFQQHVQEQRPWLLRQPQQQDAGERRLQRQQARSREDAFRSVNVKHQLLHAVQRRLAAARQELVHRRRRPVPELLELLHRHRPLLADLRRPRHARRAADRQAGRVVRRFVRRHPIRASSIRARAPTRTSTATREGGFNRSVNINVNFQPKPQVQVNVSTGITKGHDAAQWIRNEDVTGDGVDGSRLRRARSQCGQHDRARHLRVHARHDARGLPAAVRRRRRLLQHPPARARRSRSSSSRSRSPTIPTSTPSRSAATSCSAGSTAAAARCISSTTCRTATTPGPASSRPSATCGSGFGAAGTQVLMVKFNYWLGLCRFRVGNEPLAGAAVTCRGPHRLPGVGPAFSSSRTVARLSIARSVSKYSPACDAFARRTCSIPPRRRRPTPRLRRRAAARARGWPARLVSGQTDGDRDSHVAIAAAAGDEPRRAADAESASPADDSMWTMTFDASSVATSERTTADRVMRARECLGGDRIERARRQPRRRRTTNEGTEARRTEDRQIAHGATPSNG